MKVMIMTISLMVLGSCAHHKGGETAKVCKADKSCCKSGSCDLVKKKKKCSGESCDLKKKKS